MVRQVGHPNMFDSNALCWLLIYPFRPSLLGECGLFCLRLTVIRYHSLAGSCPMLLIGTSIVLYLKKPVTSPAIHLTRVKPLTEELSQNQRSSTNRRTCRKITTISSRLTNCN